MIFAIVLFVGSMGVYLAGMSALFPPLLIAGFVCLSFSFAGFPKLKNFSYTMWIFTAVAASMSYPEYFLGVGDFKFSKLITPLLQIIMFGMGSHMSVKDFAGVMKMPKGVVVGLVSHYSIMPLIGLGMISIFAFPPEIAAGVILIAATPSGMASNVMAYLAKANVALAITVTAFSTAVSPFMTPFIFKLINGDAVQADTLGMILHIIEVVVFPIIAGLSFNLFFRDNLSRKGRNQQLMAFFGIILLKNLVIGPIEISLHPETFSVMSVMNTFLFETLVFLVAPCLAGYLVKNYTRTTEAQLGKLLSLLSQLGIVIIIVVITAAGRDSLLSVGLILLLVMIMQNCLGFFLGYSLCRFVMRMPEQDCRAVTMEVGMQNGGMASSIANQMGMIESVGLAPAIYGPLQNITGSILATYWKNKPIKGQKEEQPGSQE